ncbi:MAG: cyclic nucleotide-binding domain-containing protein [Candidatus Poribacteria bacterium]|nr:cyclic nucleotide-binding domain-containing protein [Candidatus Poribacteria bacterium]
MDVNQSSSNIEVIEICPASFLFKVPKAGVSWILNPWPDISKFLIQQGLSFNGIFCSDLHMQKGVSCNLIEFPLLHMMFNQGMIFRRERPCLVGTLHQLHLASEGFRRGLYGFYDVSELEGCDLSEGEMHALMREIKGFALGERIKEADELLDLVPLVPLGEHPTPDQATNYRGLRIWKKGINVFGFEWQGEQVTIDCNLREGEEYTPPLKIDVKNIPYTLYQIIDTGEEDGFSQKSCMHTVIQWRDKIICIDLPMNVSYLLDKISVSRTEIDAVIFTHNHDDHIGELSMLLQMDKKVTVICPRIVWKSIVLKAATVFGMSADEFAGYFDYRPIRYGRENEIDYFGLRIEAHPSIHSVPCAIYRMRGIVNREWKVYSHLSDILNFHRCRTLIQSGHLSQKRFDDYREFLLEPATVKKIDVGTGFGNEDFSVHGSWKDFLADPSEHIVLAHIQREQLDETATVAVGQVAVAGSSRDISERLSHTYQDKYRERALKYLADYLFTLLEDNIKKGLIEESQIRAYLGILADNEIRLIQPNTPFLKMGEQSTFVDMVISGVGSVWIRKGEDLVRIANVNAGDLIGDMGVLQEIPRTASIRADTYMNVLRIPGPLFREAAILLKIFVPGAEGVLQKIWRHRDIVQGSRIFGHEVPVYRQNKIAQHAVEVGLKPGECIRFRGSHEGALFLGSAPESFRILVGDRELPQDRFTPPVFGERAFLIGEPDPYHAMAREKATLLKLDREKFNWIHEVPIFKLRLRELVERREIHIQRAEKMKQSMR